MNKEIINFIKRFNYICIFDLEDILEELKDNEFLSEKGEKFATEFWKEFIKSK